MLAHIVHHHPMEHKHASICLLAPKLMFTGIGLIAFCCIFGGGLAGLMLGPLLPDTHRTEDTQNIVKTIMNVVAILAALVLGLLVANIKTSFDARSKEIEQFSANLTLLDHELMHFGQDSKDVRGLLRVFTERKITQTWPQHPNSTPVIDEVKTTQMMEDLEDRLRALVSQGDVQRASRVSALQLVGDLKATSRMLVVQDSSRTQRPFLVVVIFWLSVLFLSYTIFGPRNTTVIATIFVAAVSVSIAVNLLFDMEYPFSGFIRVSPVPMQHALELMKS